MKNYPIGLFSLLFAVSFFIGLFVAELHTDKKQPIEVWEINTAPANFFDAHPEIMLPMESKIFEAYRAKKNTKWTERYVYAYVFKKHNKWFSRTNYLDSHKTDAVDREVIFSNILPDPKIFIFSPTTK